MPQIIHGMPNADYHASPAIIEYDPVADAAYRVDPETGEVLDSAAIPETQEGELLL